jgi:hypothetical protein
LRQSLCVAYPVVSTKQARERKSVKYERAVPKGMQRLTVYRNMGRKSK